jgi:AcrR family transcriptional regulator
VASGTPRPTATAPEPPGDQPDPACEAPRRRGRPREADRTDAILQAALALLEEGGYEQLHVQRVAERARVGLATIYRRWPTKQALVAEAVRCKQVGQEVPETGDPREDLAAVLRHLATTLVDPARARFMLSFLATLQAEPEIAASFREHVFCAIRDRLLGYIRAVVGDDDPLLEVRADLGPGLLFYRSQFLRDIDDPDRAGDEVARLVLGDLPRDWPCP